MATAAMAMAGLEGVREMLHGLAAELDKGLPSPKAAACVKAMAAALELAKASPEDAVRLGEGLQSGDVNPEAAMAALVGPQAAALIPGTFGAPVRVDDFARVQTPGGPQLVTLTPWPPPARAGLGQVPPAEPKFVALPDLVGDGEVAAGLVKLRLTCGSVPYTILALQIDDLCDRAAIPDLVIAAFEDAKRKLAPEAPRIPGSAPR